MVLTTGTTCAHQEDATWNEDMPLYHFIQEGFNIKATCHTDPYSVSRYFAPTIVHIWPYTLVGMSSAEVPDDQLKSSSLAPSMIGD